MLGECTFIKTVDTSKLMIVPFLLLPLLVMVVSNILTLRLAYSTAELVTSAKYDIIEIVTYFFKL